MVTQEWCRSCGADQAVERAECAACGIGLGAAPTPSSRVGLVYTVPGRLRVTKRLGICTHADGDTAHLHVSAKEKEKVTLPVAELATPEDVVPLSLSPAARLIYAYRQPGAASKAKWDSNVLSARAGELARASAGALRAVADEALSLGWEDIFDWTKLSKSEKAWRRAHHAAESSDVKQLMMQLQKLPAEGYHARVPLLIGHLRALAGRSDIREMVRVWHDAGIPVADTLVRVLGDDWSDGMLAATELFGDTAADRREVWTDAHRALVDGEPRQPVQDGCARWNAASIVTRGRASENVTGELRAVGAEVAVPIIDDLIESGEVGTNLDVSFVEGAERRYLLARLRPQELSDEEVADAGHHTESARRRFLASDHDRLRSLPSSPGVVHYRALLDVAEGAAPDAERLRPDAVQLLELAYRARAALTGGARTLPGPVAGDPTLWRMFAEQARTGHLSPNAEAREAHPDLANWCDLQRMVGLLWDERWHDAVEFGERLSGLLDDEQLQDEALSLTAYAMLRTGRGEDAVGLVDKAMTGSYTEALLVNLSVAAAEAQPEVAAAHFARIVDEAPNHEMRVAALRRAVDVWGTAEGSAEFPEELVGPLGVVLSGELSVEDYAQFSRLGANVAPSVILRLRGTPSGERDAIHRLYRAKAKLNTDTEEFYLPDLAREFLAIHREVGRPDWFNDEWGVLTSFLMESVFVPFGKALGSAVFVDEICNAAPDLFTQHQRLILLPQAGAHMAASFADSNDSLSDDAMTKFFFRPIEEFFAERSKIDSGMAEMASENFHNTLFIAAASRMDSSRNVGAATYNELVDRARWDSQNRNAILSRMRFSLDQHAQEQEAIDRAIDRLQRLAVDTDKARDSLAEITRALAEWRAETVRLRADL